MRGDGIYLLHALFLHRADSHDAANNELPLCHYDVELFAIRWDSTAKAGNPDKIIVFPFQQISFRSRCEAAHGAEAYFSI